MWREKEYKKRDKKGAKRERERETKRRGGPFVV